MTPPNPNHSDEQNQTDQTDQTDQIDEEEFRALLEQLVSQARTQSFDPRGGWIVDDPASQQTDYDIKITATVTDSR